MRTAARICLALTVALGGLAFGASNVGSAALAATAPKPTIAVVVPIPAVITSPSVTFEVTLQGTTGVQDERGYFWAVESTLLVDGYTVEVFGERQVVQVRDLGRTAVFEVRPRYNGRHQIQVTSKSSDGRALDASVLEFDVAVAGLGSAPLPPANLRVETDRLSQPVNGVVANFSYRLVADEPFNSAARQLDDVYAGLSSPITWIQEGSFRPTGSATAWRDVSVKWTDGAPLTVTVLLSGRPPGMDNLVYRKVFPLPVTFAAYGVFPTYPPRVSLSCPSSKAQFVCTATLQTLGAGKGLQVVPNQDTLIVQTRTRLRPLGFGPWRVISRVPVTLNGEAVKIPVKWPGWANPKASLQIRVTAEYAGVADGGGWR